MFRVALLACLLLCGCGGSSNEPAPTPETAEEHPHARLTREFQDALRDQEYEAARAALIAIDERFGGQGRGPAGQAIDLQLYREALVAVLIDEGFEWIDGPGDSRPSSSRGFVLAAGFAAGDGTLDPALEARLVGLGRYAELFLLSESGLGLDAYEGPQIIVLADHFALGEAVLEGMLKRWQHEHKKARLRVGILPLTDRGIRVGMRRVPASATEALAAITKQATALGLHVLTSSVDPRTWLRQHGLGPDSNLLLLANDEGLIAGRLVGRILDPTAFEEAVQRLVSR